MTDYNEIAERLTQMQEQTKKEVKYHKYANIFSINTLNEEQIEKICDFMIEEDCYSRMDASDGEQMFYAFYDSDFEQAIKDEEIDSKELFELLNVALDFMFEHKIDFLWKKSCIPAGSNVDKTLIPPLKKILDFAKNVLNFVFLAKMRDN